MGSLAWCILGAFVVGDVSLCLVLVLIGMVYLCPMGFDTLELALSLVTTRMFPCWLDILKSIDDILQRLGDSSSLVVTHATIGEEGGHCIFELFPLEGVRILVEPVVLGILVHRHLHRESVLMETRFENFS